MKFKYKLDITSYQCKDCCHDVEDCCHGVVMDNIDQGLNHLMQGMATQWTFDCWQGPPQVFAPSLFHLKRFLYPNNGGNFWVGEGSISSKLKLLTQQPHITVWLPTNTLSSRICIFKVPDSAFSKLPYNFFSIVGIKYKEEMYTKN